MAWCLQTLSASFGEQGGWLPLLHKQAVRLKGGYMNSKGLPGYTWQMNLVISICIVTQHYLAKQKEDEQLFQGSIVAIYHYVVEEC